MTSKTNMEANKYIDKDSVSLTNKVDGDYTNSVTSKNEFIISTSGLNDKYDLNKIYYNYIGTKTFYNKNLFLFVGSQSEPMEFNGVKTREDNKKYNTFKFKAKSESELSEIDIQHLRI